MKKIISTTEAPAAIGPYSQAVRAGAFVFCAGQVPLDPKSGQIVSEDISEQTRRVLDSVTAILKAEGLTLVNVVKTTVFLSDFGDFQKMNEVYATYFSASPPARSTVGVSTLPKNAKVEIEVGNLGSSAFHAVVLARSSSSESALNCSPSALIRRTVGIRRLISR